MQAVFRRHIEPEHLGRFLIHLIRYRDLMAKMRLFAGLREIAGSGEVTVGAVTVRDAIAEAGGRFGNGFISGVERARIWVNGDEADLDDPLGPDDEIAILPPVSGGAGPRTVSVAGLAGLSAGILAVILNQAGGEAVWAALVVGLVGAWIADLAFTIGDRGRDFPAGPALLSVLGSALLAHRFGFAGVALAVVLAVVVPMAWAVMSDSSRMISILAPMIMVGVVASSSVASLIVAHRWAEISTEGINVILAGLIAGSIAGMVVHRLTRSPLGDPIMSAGVVTVGAMLAAAAFFDQDLITYFIVGAVSALALVAGRGFGSIIRSRVVRLTELPAGSLSTLDGAVLATAVFLPIFRLFA